MAPSLLATFSLKQILRELKTGLLRAWHSFSSSAARQTDDGRCLSDAQADSGSPASIRSIAKDSAAGAEASPERHAKTIWVTVLVENTVHGRALQAEHGLSFLIRTQRHCILFDTGQTDLIVKNAPALDVPLSEVDVVALSHGHYDHTGGLRAVREMAPRSRIYLHPAALAPKFAGNRDGSSRYVGMNEASREAVRNAKPSVVWTTKPTSIAEGVFVTGEIPRRNLFEDTGGRFFLDEGCKAPDPLMDDQALFFDTPEGIVVLLGCAHAGVVNTVEYIRKMTCNRPIHTVLGGFHLLEASPERMSKTVKAIRNWNLQRIAPAHCTGMAAVVALWSAFPDRCSPCPVGTSIGFGARQSEPAVFPVPNVMLPPLR